MRAWLPQVMGFRRQLALVVSLGLGLAGLFVRLEPEEAPGTTAFNEIRWQDLTPKEWDPTKRFRALKLDALPDGDARAQQLLEDMRATWDNAPTVNALDGTAVRLAGYVVPLDGANDELREFLLVPYFGACIHSPPPPANQIVHVTTLMPARGLHAMDTVRVSGTMRTMRENSAMGMSGYELAAERVERHVLPQ
jgi:uncharacterized protein